MPSARACMPSDLANQDRLRCEWQDISLQPENPMGPTDTSYRWAHRRCPPLSWPTCPILGAAGIAGEDCSTRCASTQ
jgi:hypothetical protein